MSVTNQKEYLKKYLSIGKSVTDKKKKKRKRIKNETCGLKIIDDNIDTFNNAVQEDLLGETEDAPQIVEVIDDRPPSLRIDEKSNTHLWIPIGGNTEKSTVSSSNSASTQFPSLRESSNKDKDCGDISPPRRNEMSHLIGTKGDGDMFPLKKLGKDTDTSPPRRNEINENYCSSVRTSEDVSPVIKKGDMSPPRRNSRDRQMMLPRRIKSDVNLSPPRKKEKSEDIPTIIKNESSEDMSPSRRNAADKDMSPPRKFRRDVDMSPPRKNRKIDDMSLSGLNRRNIKEDTSFRRNKKRLEKSKQSRWDSDNSNSSKMTKTLDGKSAGLQNARELIAETTEIRRKEEEHFRNLSNEVSGVNASTIVRDRKTGKIRNFAEEAEKNLEKLKKKAESEQKYSRWGKGLKQVEDAAERRADALNEMNKPLARYADDEDLERYLKEQEREGDPMLAYIRKKKKKQDVDEGKPMKPEYMGEFMPNRFGIKPGHRWDGVDRSNGYEKRWFEVQNSRLAQVEEIYKWSTEDM